MSSLDGLRYRNQVLLCKKAEILKQADEFEQKEFPLEPEKEEKSFDVRKVAKLLLEIKSPVLIAKKLKAKKEDFLPWYERNLKDLTREYMRIQTEGRIYY